MAQIKTLKFNDNVTQVTSSYTVGGSTYSLPNIEIGTTHIADECGGMILHTYSYQGTVEVKDNCGHTTVSTCTDPSSGNLIFFYEGGNPYIGVGEKCGNFTVTDMCGNEMLTYPYHDNEDYALALHLAYGSNVGFQIAENCGNVCLYEHCGLRVFSASRDGLMLGGGFTLTDTCGDFNIYDNNGNKRFTIPYGRKIEADTNGFLKLVSDH